MSRLRTDPGSEIILDNYVKTNQEVMNTLPHPVFVTDVHLTVVFANKAMKRFSIECGVSCDQLFQAPNSPLKKSFSGEFPLNDASDNIELYLPVSERYLQVYYAPLFHETKIIGTMYSLLDITEIRNDEKEHRDLVDVYAHAVNDIKSRELKAETGREAFLNMLEDLNESYKELEQLFLRLIRVMINTLDAKSPWTKGHSERVSHYAEMIAGEMMLDSDDIKKIRLAGLLHDIGKIGTYDYLLDKPGKLTAEEYEIVKKHPTQGAMILKDIKQLMEIIPFVEYHHEKIDGTGYPYKLGGEKIPLGAKILHVADSFDSMTSDRPYRTAPGIEFALSELHKYKGVQFDEKVVDAFMRVLEKQIDLSKLNRFSG